MESGILFKDAASSEVFDEVLLCHGSASRKTSNDMRQPLLQHIGPAGEPHGGEEDKNQQKLVDLRAQLIHCAQTIAADDRDSTKEALRLIRAHSSMTGDATQRLAHYFANGLEARLAGPRSEIFQSYRAKMMTATDFIKAHELYLSASPFIRVSYFFSNQTILNVSEKAPRVHIVDFGINFGFQWPSLIQRISARPGGPPKLRITGIDVPERAEETGRRLADYARRFKVPLEYASIASNWEDIRVEDLRIDKDEMLVVNCMYKLRYLADETVAPDAKYSPRNMVLNTIRKMKPHVFVHGIVNGSYSAPFFVTRFRGALYHFSAFYDMLDATVPREDGQRLIIERDIYGREVLNVVACEGSERMERPETYKQWQVRNFNAGFVQNSLDREMMKKVREKVRNLYHKDFNVDEDGRWLVQGWKGRILYALSTWKPNDI